MTETVTDIGDVRVLVIDTSGWGFDEDVDRDYLQLQDLTVDCKHFFDMYVKDFHRRFIPDLSQFLKDGKNVHSGYTIGGLDDGRIWICDGSNSVNSGYMTITRESAQNIISFAALIK